VAAEFDNSVMLYSVGKDSSVMVRLAEKAFYAAKPSFPLNVVDARDRSLLPSNPFLPS
jgi:sulfate adenylyltransferase subunit 2